MELSYPKRFHVYTPLTVADDRTFPDRLLAQKNLPPEIKEGLGGGDDGRRTTDDERPTTNDQRPPTDDEPRTTDDGPPTTDHEM